MSASSVAEVHSNLGYTEADAAAIKKVRTVWKKLETLRMKAAKGDVAALRSYAEFLEKTLVSARLTEVLPDPLKATWDFWQWYLAECSALGVQDLEQARGSSHQAWCEKWLPAESKEFAAAIDRFVDMPSQVNLNEMKSTATKMLRAYVEAFKDN